MQQFRNATTRALRAGKLIGFTGSIAIVLAPAALAFQRPAGPPPDPSPFVSAIFTDNMVLQRDKPDAIWGWSDPGDMITVQMADKTATAVAGADRRWTAKLTPPPTGGPYTLKITGHKTVELLRVENPRNYFLPDGLLKPGSNSFAIRILKTKANGGFLGKAEELHLTLGDKSTVPLAGAWRGKVSVDARTVQLPISYQNWPVIPTVLYEGMVAPLTPLSITGALWYQGEENSERDLSTGAFCRP